MSAKVTGFAGALGGLLLAGLGLRLAVIAAVGFDAATFDVDSYHWHAMESLAGRPIPGDYHPVGTSWLLARFYDVFGVRPRLFYAAQALLGLAAAALVGLAARRRWGTRAGLLSAALLALLPYPAIFSAVLSSETLSLFGAALVVWLAAPRLEEAPRARFFAAALAAGLLGFVRSGLVALAAAPAAVSVARRKLGLAAALVAVALAPVVLFATLRARSGAPFRLGSASDVLNLWIGNNPDATGRLSPMPGMPRFPSAEVPDREALARLLAPRALRFIVENPGAQLRLIALRASYLVAPPKRDLVFLYGSGWSRELPASAARAAYAASALTAPLLFALVVLAFARAGDDAGVLFALGLTLLGVLPYLASLGDARYLLPLYPALAFAAGALAAPGRAGLWAGRRRLLAAAAAVALTANAVVDVRRTDAALAAVTAPGGTALRVPYHFAP